ncbi:MULTISPECIES: hypothetical protein [unclassified Acidovorax]
MALRATGSVAGFGKGHAWVLLGQRLIDGAAKGMAEDFFSA